jgi:BlaI family transcriptional regulator, penicillinase repressor
MIPSRLSRYAFMAKKSLSPLGETEMEVLHHVWDLGEASVADVHERILRNRKVAYTTIMTVMKNLATKGYLRFEQRGVTYIYRAARPPEEVRHSLVQRLVSKVFEGSAVALVQTLVRNQDLSDEERAEIARMIESMEGPRHD